MSRQPWEDELGPDEEALPEIHPVVMASNQIARALINLDRPATTFVRWPFPDLDAITGPMAPGNVWFICAASGGGKTTFVCSTIELWRAQGKKVYVMPLETEAHDFRAYLSCMDIGVSPGDVLSGNYLSWPNHREVKDQLVANYKAQVRAPFVDTVMVSEQPAINLAGLKQGLMEAKKWGADVVVVDHIDHISGGEGKNLYYEAQQVNNGALRMARDNGLLLVFTSQLNMGAGRGDALSKYQPPRTDHIAFGSLKERNATGMIGLYRPIRKRKSNESQEEYEAAIKQARREGTDAWKALEPNTMGVVAMKLRHYGANVGAKALLGMRNGRVHGLAEKDRWETGFGGSVREVYGR